MGNPKPIVALCEGQPDFCASLSVAAFEGLHVESVAPVCMTGAAMTIPEDALKYFSGKRVRIFVHSDAPGRAAAVRWANQLQTVQAEVDGFGFDGLSSSSGSPAGDLADYATSLAPDDPQRVCAFAGIALANVPHSNARS